MRSSVCVLGFVCVLSGVGCGAGPSKEGNPSGTGGDAATSGGSSGAASTSGGSNGAGATDGTSTTSGGSSSETSGGSTSGGSASTGGSAGATTELPCESGKSIVMPLGDSITQGGNAFDQGGYRARLFHLAHEDGKSITFVGGMDNGPDTVDGVPFSSTHEGHPGYKIDTSGQEGDWYGLAPLADGALSTHQPEIILLMIGTNDVLQDYELEHAGERFESLLDQIIVDAPDACLVVAQATPLEDDADDAQMVTLNALIPGFVSARAEAGKHVGMLDLHTVFTDHANFEAEWLEDGIHPTDAGYAAIASAWFTAIGELLE